jgi:hypothetical protein
VISYSSGQIILHKLMNYEDRFEDFVIRTSAPKWEISWKIDMHVSIKTLRFSTIGDFFLATGKNVVNIWKKDKLLGFNSELLHSGKDNL